MIKSYESVPPPPPEAEGPIYCEYQFVCPESGHTAKVRTREALGGPGVKAEGNVESDDGPLMSLVVDTPNPNIGQGDIASLTGSMLLNAASKLP